MNEDEEFGLDTEAPTCPRCMILMEARDDLRWACPNDECQFKNRNGFTEYQILLFKIKYHNEAVEAAGKGAK